MKISAFFLAALAGGQSSYAATLLKRLPELSLSGFSEHKIEVLTDCSNGTTYGTYAKTTLPSLWDIKKRNAFVAR